ncbi:MAG: hypothetical protein QXY27_04560 [Nitrososphaerota archaeon]
MLGKGALARADGGCLWRMALEKFRGFMILNMCYSFIPRGYLRDPSIFPEWGPQKFHVETLSKLNFKQKCIFSARKRSRRRGYLPFFFFFSSDFSSEDAGLCGR